VRIKNTLSDEITITKEVPQGTILSPILYIICDSSLPRYNLNIHVSYFLMKTIPLLISGENCDEVHLIAETEWFLKHNLRINYTKSNYINLYLRQKNGTQLKFN